MLATSILATLISVSGENTAHASVAVPGAPTNLEITPQNMLAGGAVYTNSATPTFSGEATDVSGAAVTLEFQVLSGSTVVFDATSAQVASGANASVTMAALANGAYTWQVRASDSGGAGAWSAAQAFTVDTSTPAAPSVTCTGYPADAWSTAISGGTTCSWTETSSSVSGYRWYLDGGPANWTTATSILLNPGAGLHELRVEAVSNGGTKGTHTSYKFGIGTGGVTSPADQTTTSKTVTLVASAPTGPATVEFYYRIGTSGAFTAVPTADVLNGSSQVTWPTAVTNTNDGAVSPSLTWTIANSVSADGPVQVEATFYNSSGTALVTTAPVNVLLTHLGIGQNFGTTTIGPVTVGLQSGDAEVSASDVSIASYGSALGVSRTYNSLATSTASMFGVGWTSGLPVTGSTQRWSQVTDNGTYALLTAVDGSTETFTTGTTSGGVTSYTSDATASAATLTLTKSSAGFSLTDTSGDTTAFTSPTGGTTYLPSTVSVPGSARTSAAFVYDSVSTDASYGKPLLELAPNAALPASTLVTTACPNPPSASTWAAGCRGLAFAYSTGGYVSQISFVSYDGTTLTNTPVATYNYDSSGLLKKEWDPRFPQPVKTLYAYDSGNRMVSITPATGNQAAWDINYDYTTTDANYGKVISVTRSHSATFGGATATYTIKYNTPISVANGGPINMDAATVATWGQNDTPASAVAVFPADHVPASNPTAADYTYATIHYYDATGREVNTATNNGSWNVTTTEYSASGDVVRTLSAANRAVALAAGGNSAAVADTLDDENFYSADGTELLDTYGPAHLTTVGGSLQTIRTHTHNTYDAGAPNGDVAANGQPYRLITSQVESASVGSAAPGTTDADTRTTQYVYSVGTDNTGWTLHAPMQTVTDPAGLAITKTTVYNESTTLYGGEPLVTHTYMPSTTTGGTAADTVVIYYTAGANGIDAACGNQPVWANLTCKTEPAAQVTGSTLPNLPVVQYTYNVYLEPLTKTETFGASGTRTTTSTYDAAARSTNTAITTSGTGMGAAVAKTQNVYSTTTGALTDLQTVDSTGTVIADIAATYDDFGNMLSYTDTAGNKTVNTYDIANRLLTRNDGKGTTTLTFDNGTDNSGEITSENDTLAGTFTPTFNADGALASQTYPDGTTGTYTYDSTGSATSLTYANTRWSSNLTDSVSMNAHGDWAARSVLGSTQAYTYDAANRLTNTQDTQSGGCTTRAYTYDADSNRTSTVISPAATDGSCSTANSTTESFSYDAADRLTNAGYTYDIHGDITTTPVADTTGTGNLTATYNADNMVASQTQNGTTYTWALDAQQNRFASKINTTTGVTTTDHYSTPSDSPAWTVDSTGAWSRNLLGPDGNLAAISTSASSTYQLPSLHGDLLATSQTNGSGPATTATYGEFGTAETGNPGTYGWLGADQRSTSLGGTILMGARVYNPGTGRFSQVDPVSGGSANAYDYGWQNPLTNNDTTGNWCQTHWIGSICAWSGHFAFGLNWNQDLMWYDGFGYLGAGLFTMVNPYLGLISGAIITMIGQYISGNTRQHWQQMWLTFDYGVSWWWWVPYPYANLQSVNYYW